MFSYDFTSASTSAGNRLGFPLLSKHACVVEQIGLHEPVRHVFGVDDVGGEWIEALTVKEQRQGAAEPPGCAGDENPRSV